MLLLVCLCGLIFPPDLPGPRVPPSTYGIQWPHGKCASCGRRRKPPPQLQPVLITLPQRQESWGPCVGTKHLSREVHTVSFQVLPRNTSGGSGGLTSKQRLHGGAPKSGDAPGALSTFKNSDQSPAVLGSWLLWDGVS